MIAMRFNNWTGVGDIDIDGGIQSDDGLETAVLISLFSWRRATADDLPADKANLLGFWGDTYPDVTSDLIGSRLWLLAGKPVSQETLELAVDIMREALQWLIDDGVAESVEPVASVTGLDRLSVGCWIKKPTDVAPQWLAVWEGQIGAQ